MYFWKTKTQVEDLAHNILSVSDFALYCILLSIIFLLGMSTLTFLPKLYYVVFSYLKTYLEMQVKPAPLEVIVYSDKDNLFLLINFVIVAAGFLFCWLVHKGKVKQFIIRSIALSWPIIVRLISITAILFAVIVGSGILYFLYKLLLISKMDAPQGPVGLRPLKYFFKFTGTYPMAKNLWIQAHALPKAQKIFDEINSFSFYAYWVCQLASVFSTTWWFLTLQEKLRIINKIIKNYQ